MATLPTPATIIGGPVSPYVRKVLAACEMKGVPYRVDPIVPFFGDDRFSELNPLRRIPVYIDDQVSISDSTVICEYLEERYPIPALLPKTPAERARARWIEEFADTRMGDVFIWRIFYEAVVNPSVWQRPRDKEKIARAVAEELPEVMDHLERLAPASGFLFGAVSIADISVAVLLRQPAVVASAAFRRALAQDARLGRAYERRDGSRQDHARRRHAGADAAAAASSRRGRSSVCRLTHSSVQAAAPRRGPMTTP